MHSNNTWIDILSSHLSHVDVCRPSVVQTLDIKPVCVFVPLCVWTLQLPPLTWRGASHRSAATIGLSEGIINLIN